MKQDKSREVSGKAESMKRIHWEENDEATSTHNSCSTSSTSTTSTTNHNTIRLPEIGKKFASKQEYTQYLKRHNSNFNPGQEDDAAPSEGDDYDEETTDRPTIKIVQSLEEICNHNFNSSNEQIFISQDESETLFETSHHFGHPSDVHIHSFEILSHEKENTSHSNKGCRNSSRMISSLDVGIVYQGQFCQEDYVPSTVVVRLQGKQNVAPHQKEQGLSQMKNVGHAPPHLQVPNTSKHLGRAVIKYQSPHPIANGLFQIVIWMKTFASKYSIIVSGKVMYRACDFLRQEACNFFSNVDKIKEHEVVVDTSRLDIRLSKKKIELLQCSIKDIDQERTKCESDIDDCELKLENDDNVDFLLESENILVRPE